MSINGIQLKMKLPDVRGEALSESFMCDKEVKMTRPCFRNLANSSPVPQNPVVSKLISKKSSPGLKSMTSIPIIIRSEEEKKLNPERLSLDRYNLNLCPFLQGEDKLKLLSYQHNFLPKIENMHNLSRLLFLDLSDNRIAEISGLDHLTHLQVLILAKNRIKTICNLSHLASLEILDLHDNVITKIENLGFLQQLKILNLAKNYIEEIENMSNLQLLNEINLSHNKIHNLQHLRTLPMLIKVKLNSNDINSLETVFALNQLVNLIDLSLECNAIIKEPHYRQLIIVNFQHLKELDQKKISDDERRAALNYIKKEHDKQNEAEKIEMLKEKKKLAVAKARVIWENVTKLSSHDQRKQDVAVYKISSCSLSIPTSETNNDKNLSPTKRGSFHLSDGKSYSKLFEKGKLLNKHTIIDVGDDYLMEIDGDQLSLCGDNSLKRFDRSINSVISGVITKIVFNFMQFDAIVPYLSKLNPKFPNLQTIRFSNIGLSCLSQINGLANLSHLDFLEISEMANPVVYLKLWRYYAIFRLVAQNLKKINNSVITLREITKSDILFSQLSQISFNYYPPYFLKGMFSLGSNSPPAVCIDDIAECENKIILRYDQLDTLKSKEQIDKHHSHLAKNILQDTRNQVWVIQKRQKSLNQTISKIFDKLFYEGVNEVLDLDSYSHQSLVKIRTS